MKAKIEDTADHWRFGYFEREAQGFGPDQWIRDLGAVNIRPGVSITALCAAESKEDRRKVRIYLPEVGR